MTTPIALHLDTIKSVPPRFPRLRKLLIALSWAWLGVILGWLVLSLVFAEQIWWLHGALYFPPLLWFLPGLLLALMQLRMGKGSRWVSPASLLVASLLHFPEINSTLPPAPGLPSLSVVTLNGGKREDLAPKEFVAKASPDFILLQDARDHYLWDSRLPGYTMSAVDEFVLLSKWPVLSRQLFEYQPVFPSGIATRFVVRWHNREIALYAVHLPSPRHIFRAALGRIPSKSPWGILSSETREDYAMRLDKIHAAQAYLLIQLQKEKLPVIIAGDFNLPPSARFVRRMEDFGWADSFAERGFGGGSSFPGDQPFWAAFNRPWLRLDYVFHSKEWTALSCEVEPPGPGQHSAVWAVLQPSQLSP